MNARYAGCQICGRRKATTADGRIVRHYYKGCACRGGGAFPYGADASAIGAAIAHYQSVDDALSARWRAHRERQANAPFPLLEELRFAVTEKLRLQRRLRRWKKLHGDKPSPYSPVHQQGESS